MSADHLIIGSDSQIGRALYARLRRDGHAVLGTTRRAESADGQIHLSLSDPPESWRLPERCEVTFLLAGETSLDRCEADPKATRQINVDRTLALARMMQERGSHVVFISTNLVLSGQHADASASEAVSPQCEYARQKADVEQELQSGGMAASVLRITKVGESLLPLARQWAARLKAGHAIAPFSDLVCAPLPQDYLIEALTRIADLRPVGLLQIGARPDLRYDEIALKLASVLGAATQLVQPTTSTEARFKLPTRPRFTTLDTSHAEALLGLPPLDSETALRKVLSSLV